MLNCEIKIGFFNLFLTTKSFVCHIEFICTVEFYLIKLLLYYFNLFNMHFFIMIGLKCYTTYLFKIFWFSLSFNKNSTLIITL